MSNVTKGGVGIAIVGLVGWIAGLIAESGTSDENGANIGAGILHLAGIFLVAAGLLIALAGLASSKRRTRK